MSGRTIHALLFRGYLFLLVAASSFKFYQDDILLSRVTLLPSKPPVVSRTIENEWNCYQITFNGDRPWTLYVNSKVSSCKLDKYFRLIP